MSGSIDRLSTMVGPALAITAPQTLLATLDERGWAQYVTAGADADSISEIGRLGDFLGTRTAGRAVALEEVIRPHTAEDAHPRSLR